MENQKMPEYETIRAAVAGEKWAVEKVVECYKDEIDRLSNVGFSNVGKSGVGGCGCSNIT